MSVSGARTRRAGAFDIRVVIAALFCVFGPILIGMGLFGTSDADLEKTDGMNINLWTGIGLLAAAAIFLLWAWLRPIAVDTGDDAGGDP